MSVVINVSASGLEEAAEGIARVGSSLRIMGSDFVRAGTSLNFLNKTFFETTRQVVEVDALGKVHSKTVRELNPALAGLATVLHSVGDSMRVLRVAQDMLGIVDRLIDVAWVAQAAEAAWAVEGWIADAVGSWGMAVPLMIAAVAGAAAAAYIWGRKGEQPSPTVAALSSSDKQIMEQVVDYTFGILPGLPYVMPVGEVAGAESETKLENLYMEAFQVNPRWKGTKWDIREKLVIHVDQPYFSSRADIDRVVDQIGQIIKRH